MKKVCHLPFAICPLPPQWCRRPSTTPSLLALTRATGKALLGLLLLGLAAGALRAQEPDPSSLLTNLLNALPQVQTNEAMQVEDLTSALRSLLPEEPAQGEEAGTTNGAPFGSSNEMNSGNPGSNPSYRRPSGRESRSRWSSRQQTNQFGSNAGSGSAQPGTATNAAAASLDYSAFRKVVENNIFDPNRRPNRIITPRDSTPSRDPVYFTLVGTMSYEEGTFAFFSGSSSFYQKALKCSDIIGGYTVTRISPDSVKLAQDTHEVDLRIGMQMRQAEDGSWAAANLPTTYTVNDFQPASTTSATGAATSGGPESEILKRLMEKREKE
jgi:hypothetical protein